MADTTILWGSELSPFALKIRASLEHARVPFRDLPARGGWLENVRAGRTIEWAKLRRRALRFPSTSPLDEYPLVPYVIDGAGRVLYDSSAVGRWLDVTAAGAPPLFPEPRALRFAAILVDEAFDELGLYVLHHNRWVVSGADNDAGPRLTREFACFLPPGTRRRVAHGFARRQVRRLPYLFSVAPRRFSIPGLACDLTPPSRAGFPPTHALLDEAWGALVDALEVVLSSRPFLLGERFTIADASAFGQIGGNFVDPSARARLRERAPRTFTWLDSVWRGAHVGSTGPLDLTGASALLAVIARWFVPLMRQNEAAYLAQTRAGQTLFNERAFDRGQALYDGELLGYSFRSVVKTFQVQVWRELRAAWRELSGAERSRLSLLAGHDLDGAFADEPG